MRSDHSVIASMIQEINAVFSARNLLEKNIELLKKETKHHHYIIRFATPQHFNVVDAHQLFSTAFSDRARQHFSVEKVEDGTGGYLKLIFNAEFSWKK